MRRSDHCVDALRWIEERPRERVSELQRITEVGVLFERLEREEPKELRQTWCDERWTHATAARVHHEEIDTPDGAMARQTRWLSSRTCRPDDEDERVQTRHDAADVT